MPKITFRADADLVECVESLDASKSEVMREALRAYLDDSPNVTPERVTREGRTNVESDAEGFDALLDARIDDRIGAVLDGDAGDDDVTVNVTLNGRRVTTEASRKPRRVDEAAEDVDVGGESGVEDRSCPQCGEATDADHVFCPNCGERVVGHPTCECGAELRSDWAFCPDCGRRTTTAEVLDR